MTKKEQKLRQLIRKQILKEIKIEKTKQQLSDYNKGLDNIIDMMKEYSNNYLPLDYKNKVKDILK